MNKMRIVPIGDTATLGDHRRYPGARLLLACALCGWSKSYRPERVIDRLREQRSLRRRLLFFDSSQARFGLELVGKVGGRAMRRDAHIKGAAAREDDTYLGFCNG